MRKERKQKKKQNKKAEQCSAFTLIHLFHEGRYRKHLFQHQLFLNFNPLIPRREIQIRWCYNKQLSEFQSTHPTKGDTAILHKNMSSHFYSITKNHLLFLSAALEKSNLPGLTEENNSYLGANSLEFLCELPVRTRMAFAIHSHLLLFHVASPLSLTIHLLYQKDYDSIFLHIKNKKKEAEIPLLFLSQQLMNTGA